MGIRQTFNDFQPVTRRLLIASLVAGLLLFIGFTLTDVGVDLTLWGWDPKPAWFKRYNADWFHSHAYVPNIFAGMTGFLIGVPIALVVLATFTTEREDKAALNRVNKMTQLAWEKFRDAALSLATDERIYTGLKHKANEIIAIHDEVFAEYQRRIEAAHEFVKRDGTTQYRGATDAEVLDFQEYLRNKEVVFRKRMDDANKVIGWQHDLQTQWSIIRTNWNTLSQYVRLQRLERNLSWFDDQLDAHISDDLAGNLHPVTRFMLVHQEGTSNPVSSMIEAIAHMQADIYRPVDKLGEKLLADWPRNHELMREFGWNKVEGYSDAAFVAHKALWGFKRAVEDVEKSGWPGNATQPTAQS